MDRSGERPGRPDEVEGESPVSSVTQPTPRDPRVTVVSSELPLEGGLVPGERVGRYVILNLLGRGGMGVVYSAYDPELDRKIALKLLLTTDADAGSRLQREAQAMAKLSHPNVVTIHDVGAHGGQIYLAMEFVNGDTLDAWLHKHRPPWAEILELFIAAGEGLAAAHAAGLIHRDVKPENIMISGDRRIRVMDFGLARADQAPAPKLTGQHPSLAHLSRSNILSSELTQEGHLVGTPLYMAPEQWLGLPTDARSDVFSFAVALWEALYGVHPFRSDSPAGVAVAVTEGLLQQPPSRSTVPPWIRKVLTKGLQTAPEDRWPSMRSFVDALRDDPAPRVRRFLIVGIAIAAALAIFVTWRLDRNRQARACERDATAIDRIWSPAIGQELKQAMLDTGMDFAETSSTTAIDMLNAYASDWSTVRRDTCIAELNGDIEPALYRRINACLDDHRDALQVLLTSLSHADSGVVEGAVNMVTSLQQPELCADPAQLGAYEELPKRLEEIASAQLQRLATIHAQALAGRFDQASEAAAKAKADAKETRLPHLEARASMTAGKVAELRGDFPAARQEYEAALYTAGRSGADGFAVKASLALAWIDGVRLAEFELGFAYTQLAKMWLERLQVPESDLRWQRYHHIIASLYDDQA
ncbi:MAG TPA: serine/threonine protein kinase, partial [Nannocystis exedens]|nr:serine/threonine protein kinase [Nannocystis exedens]